MYKTKKLLRKFLFLESLHLFIVCAQFVIKRRNKLFEQQLLNKNMKKLNFSSNVKDEPKALRNAYLFHFKYIKNVIFFLLFCFMFPNNVM